MAGLAAALILPAAVLSAPGAGAEPNTADQPIGPAVEAAPVELAAAAPGDLPVRHHPDIPAEIPGDLAAGAPVIVPVAHVDVAPEMLPPGDASESGLQLKTILASRSISADFPQITDMIGVRPDAKRWHPQGLALDIMIPHADSAEGIALGDEILAYAMKNADRFGVQDVIWRGVYYTPAAGPSGSGYGHFDHVHITTIGGGYPG